MATPEDIEIATVAREVEAKREAEAAIPQESMALATGSYSPNQSMVIEGELPYVPAAEASAMSQMQPEYQGGFQMQPFPSQDFANRIISDVSGVQAPYTGPMSRDPGEPEVFPTYGVEAYDLLQPYEDVPTRPDLQFRTAEKNFTAIEPTPARGTVEAEDGITIPDTVEVTSPVLTTDAPPETAPATAPPPPTAPGTAPAKGKPEISEEKKIALQSLKYTKVAGAVGRGFDRIVQAEKAQAVLSQQMGREAAEVQRGFQAQSEVNNSKRLAELESQDKNARRQVEEIENTFKNIGDFKPDRDNWWNSRTTGQKIAAAISLMISGYQHGYAGRGGVNPMLKMMMKAVDDDISDQKSEYMAKKGKFTDKKSMFATMMSYYNNEEKAHAATENVYLSDLKNRLAGIATKYSGTQAGIDAEKRIGEIEVKQQANSAALYGKIRDAQYKWAEEGRKREKHGRSMGEYLVPLRDKYGNQLSTYDKADAREVRVSIADSKHNVDTIDRMIKKIDAYGFGEWFKPSELKADLNAISIILKGSLRVDVLGPGPVQEFEREILDDLVGNTGAITGPGKQAAKFRLRALQRESTLHYEEKLKAKVRGYVPSPQRLQLKPVARKQRK